MNSKYIYWMEHDYHLRIAEDRQLGKEIRKLRKEVKENLEKGMRDLPTIRPDSSEERLVLARSFLRTNKILYFCDKRKHGYSVKLKFYSLSESIVEEVVRVLSGLATKVTPLSILGQGGYTKALKKLGCALRFFF